MKRILIAFSALFLAACAPTVASSISSSEPAESSSASLSESSISSLPSSISSMESSAESLPSSASASSEPIDPSLSTWSITGQYIDKAKQGYPAPKSYAAEDNESVSFEFTYAQKADGTKGDAKVSIDNTICMRKYDGEITQLTGEAKSITIVTLYNYSQYTATADMSGNLTLYAGTSEDPSEWEEVTMEKTLHAEDYRYVYTCEVPDHSRIRIANESDFAVYIYNLSSAA